VVALFVAGGLLAAFQPWKGALGPIETANLLRERLRTDDQFDCREPSGTPVAGEPTWDYVCVDVSNRNRQGYLVKTSGKRITAIQPTG
jgi:hypothetical protein